MHHIVNPSLSLLSGMQYIHSIYNCSEPQTQDIQAFNNVKWLLGERERESYYELS